MEKPRPRTPGHKQNHPTKDDFDNSHSKTPPGPIHPAQNTDISPRPTPAHTSHSNLGTPSALCGCICCLPLRRSVAVCPFVASSLRRSVAADPFSLPPHFVPPYLRASVPSPITPPPQSPNPSPSYSVYCD